MPLAQTVTRALARIAIPRLFDMGYSATAALNYYKTIGPGLQRKLWLTSWREITGAKKMERAYRFIPRKHALSYAMMTPTETFQQRKFKYVFDVHGREAVTNRPIIRTVSYGSDDRIAPDDVEDKMARVLADESERYVEELDFIPDAVELKAVYRRGTITKPVVEEPVPGLYAPWGGLI